MLGAIAILELTPKLVLRIRDVASADWHGAEHTFEIYRLRLQMVAGHPWLIDVDLLRVLGEQPSDTHRRRADPAHYAQIPDSELWGFSEKGAIKLLRESRHPDA